MNHRTLGELASQHCRPLPAGAPALARAEVAALLDVLPGWEDAGGGKEIRKAFAFDDYHRTMAFVNAVAWVAHREDHHPDLEVGYDRCVVRFSTHSVGGLLMNDFVCAAKVESLLA